VKLAVHRLTNEKVTIATSKYQISLVKYHCMGDILCIVCVPAIEKQQKFYPLPEHHNKIGCF
jgi:hypothetical protein